MITLLFVSILLMNYWLYCREDFCNQQLLISLGGNLAVLWRPIMYCDWNILWLLHFNSQNASFLLETVPSIFFFTRDPPPFNSMLTESTLSDIFFQVIRVNLAVLNYSPFLLTNDIQAVLSFPSGLLLPGNSPQFHRGIKQIQVLIMGWQTHQRS